MATGTITKLKLGSGLGSGFGFLKQDNGGGELFFHCSGLVDLAFDERLQSMPVEFEVVEHQGRLRAVDVRAVGS